MTKSALQGDQKKQGRQPFKGASAKLIHVFCLLVSCLLFLSFCLFAVSFGR